MIDFGILMTGHKSRARTTDERDLNTARRAGKQFFDLDKIDERHFLFQQRIDVSCFTSPSVGVVFSNLLDL